MTEDSNPFMIYTHQFNGIPLQTGDIICTRDGVPDGLYGRFWLLVGRALPGDVDHCAIYIGPGGRCVEAGPGGVIAYEMVDEQWDAAPLIEQRLFVDQLYGIAYPLANRGLSSAEEQQIRAGVAQYCLEQVALKKPYNFDFPDPDKDSAFYCSQLVYKAYLEQGIDLNVTPELPAANLANLLQRIVFPEEIWESCSNCRCA
jgi:cell wall-associated NlpC family hydrolase